VLVTEFEDIGECGSSFAQVCCASSNGVEDCARLDEHPILYCRLPIGLGAAAAAIGIP